MASYLVLVACVAVAVASPAGNYGSHGSASNYVGASSSGYSGSQSSASGYSGSQQSSSSGYSGNHQSSAGGYSGGQSSAGGYSGGQSSAGGYSSGQSSAGGYSGGQSSAGGYSGGQSSAGYSGGHASAPVVPILYQDGNINDDGSYHFRYETGDYSARQEQADAYNYVQGSYNYVAPDGQKIEVTYTADQNGYVAHGAHLPTPVPSPYPFNMIIGGQGGQYGGSQSAPQYGGSQGAPQYGGGQQQSGGNGGY